MSITPQAGYIVDPNNPNGVIKDPNSGYNQFSPTAPSIAYGAVNNPVISSSSLQPVSTTPFPTTTPNNTNYQAILDGAKAQALSIQDSIAKMAPPEPAPVAETTPPNWFQKTMDEIKKITRPNSADTLATLEQSSDLSGKQTSANQATQARLASQAKLAAIQAKIAGLDMEGTTQNLALENQGGAITSRGVANASQANNREIAIRQLPLRAEELSAQAEVAAAQGNEQLAQNILSQAQNHIDRVFQIQTQDANNQYDDKMKQIEWAFQYADKEETKALNAKKEQVATNQSNLSDARNFAQSLSTTAMTNGQANIASQLASLAVPDINSKTFTADLQKYNEQVATLQGQIRPKSTTGGVVEPGDNPQLYTGLSSATATAVRAKVNAFKSEPQVQNFATVQDGYNFASSINTKTTNPADDQALIYALAKALDPGSVVREGEYATAQKYAQSWVKAYGKSIEQAMLGTGFLSETARKNIKETIKTKYLSTEKTYQNLYSQYSKGINNLTGRNNGDQFIIDYKIENNAPANQVLSLDDAYAEYQKVANQQITTTATPVTPVTATSNWKSMLPDMSGFNGFSLGSIFKQ